MSNIIPVVYFCELPGWKPRQFTSIYDAKKYYDLEEDEHYKMGGGATFLKMKNGQKLLTWTEVAA